MKRFNVKGKLKKVLPKGRKKNDRAACKACDGTSKNSKGGLCVPCTMNGRAK